MQFWNFGKLASLKQCQNFAKITSARFTNSSLAKAAHYACATATLYAIIVFVLVLG
jgi:membrane-anchored protein YejM (alkaline phosphatase superfamily)